MCVCGVCRGLETGLDGWSLPSDYETLPKDQLLYKLRVPNPERFTILKQVPFHYIPLQGWVIGMPGEFTASKPR